MDIIKGRITAVELARSHDLTVVEVEVEQWMDNFVSQGTDGALQVILAEHALDGVTLLAGQAAVSGHLGSAWL